MVDINYTIIVILYTVNICEYIITPCVFVYVVFYACGAYTQVKEP